MITNFEDYTVSLTDNEKEILPDFINAISKVNKAAALNAPEIVQEVRDTYPDIKFSQATLRKFCNHIRRNGLLPLIATPKGYYISYDAEEVQKQIDSLKERASAILASAEGLSKFITT